MYNTASTSIFHFESHFAVSIHSQLLSHAYQTHTSISEYNHTAIQCYRIYHPITLLFYEISIPNCLHLKRNAKWQTFLCTLLLCRNDQVSAISKQFWHTLGIVSVSQMAHDMSKTSLTCQLGCMYVTVLSCHTYNYRKNNKKQNTSKSCHIKPIPHNAVKPYGSCFQKEKPEKYN